MKAIERPVLLKPEVRFGSIYAFRITVHQEYICEQYGQEFTAIFALNGCYDGVVDH